MSGIHAQIAGKGFKKSQRARGNRGRLGAARTPGPMSVVFQENSYALSVK
jgi:hypothetical protein